MKKGIVISLSIIVAILLTGVIALNIVNSKAEDQVISALEDSLVENGLDGKLKYSDIKVSSLNGSMTLNNIEIADDEVDILVDSVKVQLPMSEALGIARNPDDAVLTNLKVNISGLELKNKTDGTNLTQGDFSMVFKGSIKTKIFSEDIIPSDDDFLINTLEFSNDNVVLTSEIGEMSFDNFNFGLFGNIKASDFEQDFADTGYKALLNLLNRVTLNFQGFKFIANQEVRESLSMLGYMYLGDVSFMGNDENWAIDRLSLDSVIDGSNLSIESLDLVTSWIDFDINASFNIDDTLESITPFNIQLNMNNYIAELKPLLEMFIGQMTGDNLPDDNFSLNIAMEDMNSYPEVTIEKLN